MSVEIKARLLALCQQYALSNGRVNVSPEQVKRRLGVSGHDFMKNLDELRQEGVLEFHAAGEMVKTIRLKRGALNEAILRDRAPRSFRDEVIQWLLRQPQKPIGGWVNVTPGQVLDGLNVPTERRNSSATQINQLVKAGRLEARHDGRRVVALRVGTRKQTATLRLADAIADVFDPSAKLQPPATPHLDQYLRARRAAALIPSDNPYVSVAFERNELAEEGLALKQYIARQRGEE